MIADSFDRPDSNDNESHGYPQGNVVLMSWEMKPFCDIVLALWETHSFREDEWNDDDVDVDVDNEDADAGEEKEEYDGVDMTNIMQKMIPIHIERGTCPHCKGCGFLGTDCLE